MQHKSLVSKTEPQSTATPPAIETDSRGPQPLETSQLKQVAGGGPKGGWIVPEAASTLDGPKGGW